jgi:hypothetical protein
MTNPDHDQGGARVYTGSGFGRNRRTVLGVAGLAAVLGVGAFVVTDQLTKKPPTPRVVAEPAVSSPSAGPSSAATTDAAPTSRATGPVLPARAQASPSPSTVKERVDQARSANERLGTEVRSPLTSKVGGYVADPSKIKVETIGTVSKDRRQMRVVSAPLDLTGQRELAWVADGGEPYRGAHCSQTIKMSNNAEAKVRPTLLVCWRTSATRSAYTLLVDLDKKPSKEDSIAALDRAWAKLG